MTIKMVYVAKCDEPLCSYESDSHDDEYDAITDLEEHIDEIHSDEEDDE